MSVFISIMDTETQKLAIIKYDCDSWEDVEFMWREGNFACDCNRSAFFEYTDEDHPCSSAVSRFKVVSVVTEFGYLVYSELRT